VADKYTTIAEVTDLQSYSSPCHIFDCRCSLADDHYGQNAYRDGHIPNAQFVDLNNQLSGPIIPRKTGRHPLPSKGVFIEQIRTWGVTNDSQIFVYDDNHGAFAARLWWMFRWVGHVAVAVLNGGFQQWKNAGMELATGSPDVTQSSFEPAPALTKSIDADDVLNQPGILTDARDIARFLGEVEPIDAVAGHIPGATCLPFTENLVNNKLRPASELKQRFIEAGIEQGVTVTCYCGSGVTATHNILALIHAGYEEPTLYSGSWSDWITNPDRPVATGESPI